MTDKAQLHVIDKTGRRLTIPFPEKTALESEYIVDDEWYLSHGYVTLKQHRAHLDESPVQPRIQHGRNG